MAGIEKRIEALEAAFGGPDSQTDTGAREKLIDDFSRRALDAMASIKRAPIDAPRWRYSVEKLRGESPITVAAHVAALACLEHEDEDVAREILAGLERDRDLDPAPHEKLIEAFVGMVKRSRAS